MSMRQSDLKYRDFLFVSDTGDKKMKARNYFCNTINVLNQQNGQYPKGSLHRAINFAF